MRGKNVSVNEFSISMLCEMLCLTGKGMLDLKLKNHSDVLYLVIIVKNNEYFHSCKGPIGFVCGHVFQETMLRIY